MSYVSPPNSRGCASTFTSGQAHEPLIIQVESHWRAGTLGGGSSGDGYGVGAAGVLMDEALVQLRAYAFADGRSFRDVARDVVSRRLTREAG
jgi:hypothetical protein